MSNRTIIFSTLIGIIGAVVTSAALAADTDTKNAVRVAGQLTKIDGKSLTIAAADKETVITCTDALRMYGK